MILSPFFSSFLSFYLSFSIFILFFRPIFKTLHPAPMLTPAARIWIYQLFYLVTVCNACLGRNELGWWGALFLVSAWLSSLVLKTVENYGLWLTLPLKVWKKFVDQDEWFRSSKRFRLSGGAIQGSEVKTQTDGFWGVRWVGERINNWKLRKVWHFLFLT